MSMGLTSRIDRHTSPHAVQSCRLSFQGPEALRQASARINRKIFRHRIIRTGQQINDKDPRCDTEDATFCIYLLPFTC